MKKFYNWLRKNAFLIWACIVAFLGAMFLVLAFSGAQTTYDVFRAACAQAGGQSVYDGRQMVCIK